MDNCIFASAGAHLARCQPCAPRPAPVVSRAGTKAVPPRFLWISTRLCQNYPQFYAPCASAAGNGPKRRLALQLHALIAHQLIANERKPCSFSLAARVRAKPVGQRHPLWLKADGVPQVVGALHPLVRRERHRTPPATSLAASQGCERSTGQDRRAEPLLPHSGINRLSVRLPSWPMGRSPAVDRCPDWGFWLFFKGFIYK